MLSDQELEILLTDLESDRVERKESISDPARIRQAICAFVTALSESSYCFLAKIGTGRAKRSRVLLWFPTDSDETQIHALFSNHILTTCVRTM